MKKFILIISLVFLSVSCNPFAATPQAGVFKTVNGGADWRSADALKRRPGACRQPIISNWPLTRPIARRFLPALQHGLYKSDDAAATWTNLSNIQVFDFAVNPQNFQIIYAAGCAWITAVSLKRDGGASWNEVYHESTAPIRFQRGH